MSLDNKISNIIGSKLPQWVLNQLQIRSIQNNKESRDNDNIAYLSNKTAWVRLVSSVNIKDSADLNYFKTVVGDSITDPESLSKEFVLFGGVSKYLNSKYTSLRSGLGKDGAYGILGQSEISKFGYRPMPGITNVNIDTQGRLGSVKLATVEFKCWDKDQLDIIDALYFKLGFTMFLEWGHTNYYSNKTELKSTELDIIDPFQKGLTKEDVYIKIANNSRKSDGNYDAMLGIVSNFNFSYNQEGGYDCTLRIIALGSLADNIRINNAGVLPDLLEEEIRQLNNILVQIEADRKAREAAANSVGYGSVSSKDKDPKVIESYPSCIQNLHKVIIADTSKSNATNKDAALFKYAANATFGGESIYFYIDGQYQTTGFSKSGRWECLNGELVLDGIMSLLAYLNKNINNKQGEPDFSELGKIINKSGYIGSKGQSINDYDYLYSIPNRGWSLLFTRFGVILPTENIVESVSAIELNTNYLFEKISNFLQFKPTQQSAIPNSAQTISGTNIPSTTTITQNALNQINTLEYLMFNNKSISNNQDLIRLDINYQGANTKSYYASLRVEFSRTNPNFKKEILNKQAVYENAISQLRSSANKEFTSIAFEARPIIENNSVTEKPFGTIDANKINSTSKRYPVIKLSTTINVTVDGTVLVEKKGIEGNSTITQAGKVQIPVSIDVYIMDPSLITSIKKSANSPSYLKTQQNLTDQNQVQTTQTTTNTESNQTQDPETISTQIKQALNYQSTLEIMLRTIQIHSLNKAIKSRGNDLEIGRTTNIIDLYDSKDIVDSKDPNSKNKKTFLQQIFSTGIFTKYINGLVNNTISDSGYTTDKEMVPEERFKIHAKYGFASSLMGNKAELSDIPRVDYKELLKAYVVPYQINQEIIKGTSTNHPVYIPFGLLLMILNHACTIYDRKEGDSKFETPLIYIDFNPETNFCLSNKKHLSTNPWKVLIPFEGDYSDYKALFPKEILLQDANGSTYIKRTSNSNQDILLYNPTKQDFLSGYLPRFKFNKVKVNEGNSSSSDNNTVQVYRGKIMNILLNVDYLVKTAQDYSFKDGTNSVYLKTFIEHILSDVNKYLGNINMFRLAYNDAGNTFQIVDDQVIPTLEKEESISPKNNSTQIPVLGKFSIAKNMEIKTDISNRLSNMIAISSNASNDNKATNSIDASGFGFINTNYVDRYIPNKIQVEQNKSGSLDTIKISAAQFNQAVSDFYSKINPAESTVSHATNYYIDKMANIKNDEFPTRASAMIPVSINITTDGISGLGMGQGFTIPDQMLPYTYTSRKVQGLPQDYVNSVGFVIVGLTHTINNNQWDTALKANMIYLKEKTVFNGSVVDVSSRAGVFEINTSNETTSITQQTYFVGSSKEAKLAAETYLGRSMSDQEWSQLVAATFAEASDNQTERAWVMAVILNRTRTKYSNANTIADTLTAPNQFQAVTGTKNDGYKPSQNYVNGPNKSSADSIYGAAINLLSSVPKNYLFFTSNKPSAYGPGTNIAFLDRLKSKPGSKIIGYTVFSITG